MINGYKKIRNISSLDYPIKKLKVSLFCDGCTDNTASIAKQVIIEPECRHLDFEVVEFANNRGKIAVLNEAIAQSHSELVALSDVSALVSIGGMDSRTE